MELIARFENDEERAQWKDLDPRQQAEILLLLGSMKLLSENNQDKLLAFSRYLLSEQESMKKGTGSAG